MVDPDLTFFLFIVVVSAAVVGAIGALVARAKNRSEAEGCLLGFLLGPFGMLIEALLPTQPGTQPFVGPYGVPALPPGVRFRPADGRVVRDCPFCAEEILANAVVCRFCSRPVQPVELPPPLPGPAVRCYVCQKPLTPDEARDFNGVTMCPEHYASAIL